MVPQNAEVAPVVLWEKPPKPAGWSAIWEVLPPPPPPPFGQDGVWIWVPEGEEAPVGGMVPHEGAFLPCADLDDDSEEADAASQIPAEFQGFTNPMQAPFAEKSLGPAPASEYSSSGGLQETQIVQISNSTLPATSEHIAVSHQSNVPLGFSGVFHSQKSVHSTPPAHAAGMSAGQRGFGSAKDAFGMPSPATPRPGNEDAFSTKSATAATAFQSNPYPSLPGVVQATMRETPPPSQTQVWNPFPSRTTISADPPGEQAWNPWASIGDGDGPFSRSLQDTQRRIVGDIGAFTSDDWRPPVGNANPPLWPCPSSNAGLQSTPRVQLLDVTGAGSGFRRNMDPPGRSDFVLGPMHPVPAPASCGATWMDDPRLAQMPVAQIAERNRYAAPVLLDVTSGGQSFRPDD